MNSFLYKGHPIIYGAASFWSAFEPILSKPPPLNQIRTSISFH